MPLQMQQKAFTIFLPHRLNSFTASIIMANKKRKIDIRLIPCIYFMNPVRGELGSFFLIYKYSATCLNIPID